MQRLSVIATVSLSLLLAVGLGCGGGSGSGPGVADGGGDARDVTSPSDRVGPEDLAAADAARDLGAADAGDGGPSDVPTDAGAPLSDGADEGDARFVDALLDTGDGPPDVTGGDVAADAGDVAAPVPCAGVDECPPAPGPCVRAVCEGGVCAVASVEFGTPLAEQVIGDCRVEICDGNGSAIWDTDIADVLDDGSDCTRDLCAGSTPTNVPVVEGTRCDGGVCDGGTRCVPCLLGGDCPGDDGPCRLRTCVAETCGVADTAPGTALDEQLAGDCRRAVCDGQGATTAEPDDADVPDDADPCTLESCLDGEVVRGFAPAETPCGANGRCDGEGRCVGCLTAADCPGEDTECRQRACADDVCGTSLTPEGVALVEQTAGDCQLVVCDGAGGTTTRAQAADLPSDGEACTTDTCDGAVPRFTPVPAGVDCGAGRRCDGAGRCVECLAASECPGVDGDCSTRTCLEGACGRVDAVEGTPLPRQTLGDCRTAICDGLGGTAWVAADADVADDGDPCTTDRCDVGAASHPPAPARTPCGGGRLCDGAGTCVACLVASDCAGTDAPCAWRVCEAATCDVAVAPFGAEGPAPVPGNCLDEVCDGAGGTTGVAAPTDVPDDGNSCTDDTCAGGAPSHPPVPAGTPCMPDGVVCDANGVCLECVTGADCESLVCSDNVCRAPACDDSVANGAETDVDCGGPDCGACAPGDACVLDRDCDSDACAEGVCQACDPVPLLGAVPPVAYAGITTPLTVFATAPITDLTVVLRASDGRESALSSTIAPAHPKRIAAEVPRGTDAGTYDVVVRDARRCKVILPAALRVTATATPALGGLAPAYGWAAGVTEARLSATGGLAATPWVYLVPEAADDVAVELASVTWRTAALADVVVPSGVTEGAYDVVAVNPDGSVATLAAGASRYRSVPDPPPTITAVEPRWAFVDPSTAVTVRGTNFRNPTVSLRCVTERVTGTRTAVPVTRESATATSLVFRRDAGEAGLVSSACDVRVTNTDGSYAERATLVYDPGLRDVSRVESALPAPRRAPAVASATVAGRQFLFVAGGDGGTLATALDGVVTAETDAAGLVGAWFEQRERLGAPRTLAGMAALGRYLYLVGGNDGTGPVATVRRATLLDPAAAPEAIEWDLDAADGSGLAGGTWTYRVAAVMDTTDADNPGGETLASRPLVVRVPAAEGGVRVSLWWTAVDGSVGYRVYRSLAAGDLTEGAVAYVAGRTTTTWTDGGATGDPGVVSLPLGSTGRWRTLPSLATRRESTGVVIGADPVDATRHYLYAMLGRDTAALATYERLSLTVGADGRQTYGMAWVAGTQRVAQARYQHVTVVASPANSDLTAGATYVYRKCSPWPVWRARDAWAMLG